MPIVYENSVCITAEENKTLQEKLDEVQSVADWIEVVEDLWSQAGLQLNIEWYPVLKEYTKWGETDLCWVANIKGNTKDLSPKKRSEVYSLGVKLYSIKNNKIRADYYFDGTGILRHNNSSGGGGNNFSYYDFRISIKDFPKMAEKYARELDEVFVQSYKDELNAQYKSTIEELVKTFNYNVRDYVSADKKTNDAETMVRDVENLLIQVKRYKEKCLNEATDKAKRNYAFTVPKCEYTFLDQSLALRAKNIQQLSTGESVATEEGFTELKEKFKSFVDKHAEKLV